MPIKVPQETINLIYGQLNRVCEVEDLKAGMRYENGMQGQMEIPTDSAAKFLKSEPLFYSAEVVEKEGKLEWEIKGIIFVNFQGAEVIW